jgi:hypothetical protein
MMKNIFVEFRNKAGLTLVEMFVALLLFSLLISLAMSVYVSVARFLLTACGESRFIDSGHFILTIILDDLRSCNGIIMKDSSFLIIGSLSLDTNVYERKDGNIVRNGAKLNPGDVTCTDLNLKIDTSEKPIPGGIILAGKCDYSVRLVNIYIELCYKGNSRSFKTSVRLKNVSHIY